MMQKKIIVLLLIIFLTGIFILNRPAEKAESKSDPERPLPVEIYKVKEKDIFKVVNYTGTVSADGIVRISPSIGGIIQEICIEEGDNVHKGDIIATLDDKKIRAQVNKLTRTVESAHIDSSYWDEQFEKFKRLYEEGAVSKHKFDEISYKRKMSHSKLKEVQAALREAELLLQDTIIKSPIEGRIDKVYLSEGSYAVPGQPVLTLIPVDKYYLDVKVAQGDLKYITSETDVIIKLNDGRLDSKVEKILPALDRNTRSATLRVGLPGKINNALYPGLGVEVEILLDAKEAVSAVPVSAVREEGEKEFVFVVKDNKAVRKIIRTGITDGEFIEVEGLEIGEEVITSGSMELWDGREVLIYEGGNKR